MRLSKLIAISIIALGVSGCDAVKDAWNDPDLEATIRREPGRAGKVGTIVALGVRQTALRSSQRIASPLEPACQVQLGQGESRDASLVIERTRDDEFLVRWQESRRLRHGLKGGWHYDWSADFVTLVGTTGRRAGGLIEANGEVWIGRDPGLLWYRADEVAGRAPEKFTRTLDSFVRLVEWEKDGPRRWTAGDRRFRCARDEPNANWAARIAANRGRIVQQRFEVNGSGERSLDLAWRLPDGTQLTVRWRDQPGEAVEEIGVPATEQIVDVERDLSYNAAHEAVERWAAESLMERVDDESKEVEDD